MPAHNNKVCHLSSVHPVHDTRIFHKECKTLLSAGYDVTLIVQHDGDKEIEGIKIKEIKKPLNRKERMLKTSKQLYKRALECNANIYHFHDPELIPIGLRLKQKGKKVIYDVHEDVPRQILAKHWIPGFLRTSISWAVERIENYAAHRFDYIVTATPYIRDRFLKVNKRTIDVNNFPILTELYTPNVDWDSKEKSVCYVGGIGGARGIQEMVEAIGMTDCTLLLAGKFTLSAERETAASKDGWHQVVELGHINRNDVRKVLSRSMAGLVLFHPGPNHTNAQPNKMFEYMSASIPIITSNFPLWRKIVEGNNCGICVNPLDAGKIAKAINWITSNPEKARRMGENGRKAVEKKYNWEREGSKLTQLYGRLLS
ncbi:MAG: glycosyltransferase family 4 protein [Firmicutes bacterium]|nr:glycosyltransferase family 4 protein [Bacillota bacterium]